MAGVTGNCGANCTRNVLFGKDLFLFCSAPGMREQPKMCRAPHAHPQYRDQHSHFTPPRA